MFLNRRWNRTDKSGLIASSMVTNWPKNVAGNNLDPVNVVTTRHDGRSTLIAGTHSVWTLLTADSLVVPYPLYGVLTSTDDGVTWSMSNTGLGQDLFCHDMVAHNNVVYALMGYAIGLNRTRAWLYRSTDHGQTWTRGATLPPEFKNPMELTVDRNGTVYCAGGGLVKSRDMGDSWEAVNGPDSSPFEPYDCLATEDGLYAVTEYGLYKSDVVSSVTGSTADDVRNPIWVDHAIQLSSANDISIGDVQLHDVYGRSIVIELVGQQIIPIGTLSSGLYLLTITGRTYKLLYTR